MAAMLERLPVLLPGPRAPVSLPIRPLGSHVMQAVVVFGFANWKKAFGSKSQTGGGVGMVDGGGGGERPQPLGGENCYLPPRRNIKNQ